MKQGCCCNCREQDMSDDYIILGQVMDDHQVTPKRLAGLTGRAAVTVYKYLSGEATIPSVVWGVLFNLTKDQRIVSLFVGEVNVSIVPFKLIESQGVDALKHLLEVRKKQIGCEKLILDILGDGKVDRSDALLIQQYKQQMPEMIAGQWQIHQAITKRYEEAGK